MLSGLSKFEVFEVYCCSQTDTVADFLDRIAMRCSLPILRSQSYVALCRVSAVTGRPCMTYSIGDSSAIWDAKNGYIFVALPEGTSPDASNQLYIF